MSRAPINLGYTAGKTVDNTMLTHWPQVQRAATQHLKDAQWWEGAAARWSNASWRQAESGSGTGNANPSGEPERINLVRMWQELQNSRLISRSAVSGVLTSSEGENSESDGAGHGSPRGRAGTWSPRVIGFRIAKQIQATGALDPHRSIYS